jgi:hypothetical protein
MATYLVNSAGSYGKNVAGTRYYTADDPQGVTPSKLKRLGRARQLEYMEAWFREYYEDPANKTPHPEGEFVYPWGGPYDAFDELGSEFGDLVPEDRIQELAEELRREHIDWAPTLRKQREMEEGENAARSATPRGASSPDPGPLTDAVPFFSNLVSDPVNLYRAPRYRRWGALQSGGAQDPPTVPSSGDTSPLPAPDTALAGDGGLIADAKVVSPLEPDAGVLPASTEQRPAAYRFELRGGKIDILPEPPEPEDRGFRPDAPTLLLIFEYLLIEETFHEPGIALQRRTLKLAVPENL